MDETNEVEVKGKRGRQPTEYLTRAKFFSAVRDSEILPGMNRVAEVLDGARIVTHAGYTATVFEPTATGLSILQLGTSGRGMRPEVVNTVHFTFDEVIAKLTAPARKPRNTE